MSTFESAKQGASLKCPGCGGKLTFDPETQKLICGNCGNKYDEDEISEKTSSLKDDEVFDEELKDYHCPSCGAEILGDQTTATEFCVYCGSPVVFKGRVSGLLKPRYIIPFSVSKNKAKECLKDYLKDYMFIPKSFFKEANLEKMSGIYYPFWEADCDTVSKLSAEGVKISSWTTGNRRYTEKKYFLIQRAGKIHFEDITVNALKGADKKLIESVLPYKIDDHKDFKMEYLSGFHAKKNDLSFDDVNSEIKSKIGEYAKEVLLSTVDELYDNVEVTSTKSEITAKSHDYVMLPVWVLCYKYRGKTYTFAVNGTTGKVFGEIPLSKGKLFATFGSIAAGLFALISLIGGLL